MVQVRALTGFLRFDRVIVSVQDLRSIFDQIKVKGSGFKNSSNGNRFMEVAVTLLSATTLSLSRKARLFP